MDGLPDEIAILIGRYGIANFDSDDMSTALRFSEMLWRRLTRMAEHYERQSQNFMPDDIRRSMMQRAAKDMRHVLEDTKKDL